MEIWAHLLSYRVNFKCMTLKFASVVYLCIFMGNIPQIVLLFHKEIRIASGFQIMVQNRSINLLYFISVDILVILWKFHNI